MDTNFWTPQLILNTFVAVTGGFQYGYHLSELNSPQQAISCQVPPPAGSSPSWFENHGFKQCIPLSDSYIGLVTSLYPIGGLVGSGVASFISDRYGRKNVNLINAIMFFIGSILETFANEKSQLCIGRFISGIAAGCTLVNSPLMLNEIAYDEIKGMMGTMNQVFTNTGILFTQFIAIWLANGRQWRYILLTGACVAAFNILVSFLAVETPKWLIKNNQPELAERHLTYLRPKKRFSASDIKGEINEWIVEIGSIENSTSNVSPDEPAEAPVNKSIPLWKYITSSEYNKSKMVATIILAAQQLSGIPAIFFYGNSIVSTVLPQYSVLLNCMLSLTNIVFTMVAGLLIDRVGRKVLLMASNIFMFVSAVLMAVGIVKNIMVLAVVMVFLFVSFFAIGMGPIPFLIVAEVTQLNATTAAQSYGTAMNWIVTVVIGYVFPIVKSAIGGYVFLIFAGFLAITIVLVGLLFPETKGKRTYNEVWSIHEDSESLTHGPISINDD
ncbi:hypothetical protein DASC09_013700 [Saccharomycopsis crataegensis]|uniref:Major facilitator superfamily (MFS) profile domain-containing protein n=1 Tax=Saccharomycopsis crataegensis TaxID=43959 RepID=A0AAV5QGI2_9ASCO|nr:hypothetical protein DASC09_013700 [Saccharomycopsis crataegensis]